MHQEGKFSYLGIVLVGSLWLAGLMVAPTPVKAQGSLSDASPGFGLIYGEGKTEHGGELARVGFSSRRLVDDDRIGSLALLAEQHDDGLRIGLLDPGLEIADVSLRYQSVYMEMKRYIPIAGQFNYYWGLRGGYSRVQGEITGPGGEIQSFQAQSLAPLAMLALPLALEHPGFLLLAFTDGTSAGLTFDIVPERIWLDYQISAVILPRFRNTSLVLEDLMVVTQVLQLAIVF